MDYKEKIVNYIEKYENGEPIFIEDIKRYILSIYDDLLLEKERNNLLKYVNVIMNRLCKENNIKAYTKGIYYKPIINQFGEMPLNRNKIIERKYLMDSDGKVQGYIAGEKLFNKLGLTTQIPKNMFIVTNNCGDKNKYYDKAMKVIVKKSRIEITDENYIYLQLLDVLSNKDRINIEVNNKYDIIYDYIVKNNLDFEKIIKFARKTNNKKILDELYILAR